MPAFFDSSVLLSILLNDQSAPRAAGMWLAHEDRVASTLIEVESLAVLRRIESDFERRLPRGWLAERKTELAVHLEEIALKQIDDAVIEIIRREDGLGGCRSLDAIHLATALLFHAAAAGPLAVCTLDKKMAAVCKRLGLSPES